MDVVLTQDSDQIITEFQTTAYSLQHYEYRTSITEITGIDAAIQR